MMTSMGNPLQAAADVLAERVPCALNNRVSTPALWRVSLTHREVSGDRMMKILSQHHPYTQFDIARINQDFDGAKCLPFLECFKSEVM